MPRVSSRDPIRIARIITRLNIGGPAIQAVDLSARLEAAGYHTLLIHGRLGPSEGDMSYLVPRDRRFEIEYLPTLQRPLAPAADAAALARLVRLLRRFQPAIVHTHMAKAGTLGRLAALACSATRGARERVRIVHTYHGHVLDGYFGARTGRAFATAERVLGRCSDALLAVSPGVRRDLLDTHRIGTPDRLHVVALGFNLDALAEVSPIDKAQARRQFDLDPDAHVVSFVGRLTAIKQPDLFLLSAARIAQADSQARFLVAGGGELEGTAQARALELGLGDRMRFLGWQRDIVPVHAASDLLALTSGNEGTPVALIESMAAAVPGIAFAVGGVPDVIAGPELGILVPAGDVDALAARALDLLHDDGRRTAMGERARAHVLARYRVERLVADLDGLYRQML